MLPVYAHTTWQVEAVLIDLGVGMREYWEIRHGNTPAYCTTRVELDAFLAEHGLALDQFTPVDTIDDGCE